MAPRPSPSRTTKRIFPALAFLSRPSAARTASRPACGDEGGRGNRSSTASTRRTCSGPSRPSRADTATAARIPSTTASPCRSGPCPVTASSAWPTVWPKFRSIRGPRSSSSSDTSRAFSAAVRPTTPAQPSSSAWPPPSTGSAVSSSSNSSLSSTSAVFTTSARPFHRSRTGSVRSVDTSATTRTGGWKAPIRFFPSR